MDVPAYEIVFCISKTQYSLCRQHKCPLFHDIVFYAHYTSFAMRCQHNSTLFLLLWLVFLVDFCGFSLFLLKSTIKPKSVFRFSYFDFGKRFSNYIFPQIISWFSVMLWTLSIYLKYICILSICPVLIFSTCATARNPDPPATFILLPFGDIFVAPQLLLAYAIPPLSFQPFFRLNLNAILLFLYLE